MASESAATTLRRLVRRPFRGNAYYEWQVGPWVFQVARGWIKWPFHLWRDPFWKGTP